MTKSANQGLQQFEGYLVHRLGQVYASSYWACQDRKDITPAQCAALVQLSTEESTNQSALAQELGIDVATMGQVVSRLTQKGLISQSASREDRRKKMLQLTAAGRKLVDELVPRMFETDRRFRAPLTDDEMVILRKLLLKIIVFHDRYCPVPFALPQEKESA